MKRIIGFLLDTLFFVSFLFVIGVIGLIVVYMQQYDISILNVLLQTQLVPTMYVVYGMLAVAFLLYYWIFPTMLHQTVGQRLAGTSYKSANGKVTLWNVFMRNLPGKFWDLLFFPYTIFAAITKRPLISTNVSGLSVTTEKTESPRSLLFITIFMVIFMVGGLGVGAYVYRTGLTPIMERFTNYQKQVEDLIGKFAYQDASLVLEKYKQYNGETPDYAYYKCEIEANLDTEENNLALCETALTRNSGNTTRTQEITALEAKIYAANGDYTKAQNMYSTLWTTYNVRTMVMKDYVVVLSELGKSKEATDVLTELAKQVNSTDTIGLRDIGNLYERIGNNDLALQTYQTALAQIPEGTNTDLAGELYYDIGVIQYKKGNYVSAKTAFETAKTLNKDYTEPVDSYIILISKLKNSVIK